MPAANGFASAVAVGSASFVASAPELLLVFLFTAVFLLHPESIVNRNITTNKQLSSFLCLTFIIKLPPLIFNELTLR
jgi:hypothetical protein